MVEEKRREARRIRGNVTEGGRYGTAPKSERHMEPEVPPEGMESAELRVPKAVPGALPENVGEKETEERSIVRLPGATAEELEEK